MSQNTLLFKESLSDRVFNLLVHIFEHNATSISAGRYSFVCRLTGNVSPQNNLKIVSKRQMCFEFAAFGSITFWKVQSWHPCLTMHVPQRENYVYGLLQLP